MATKKDANPVEAAWNKTRGDGDPEFAQVSPDFRAKLQSVYGAALAGQPESGIAGLEEFEKEIRSGVKSSDTSTAPQPGVPTVRDPAAVALGEQQAETTPKGSGAQEGSEEKALKDAAGAAARVEANETHSPSFPSAARPLAAEAPGNAPSPEEAQAATKTTSKRSKASAATTAAASKASTKSTSKKK